MGNLLCSELGYLFFVGEIWGCGFFWVVEFMLFEEDCILLFCEVKFCDWVVKWVLELGLNVLGNLGVIGEVYVNYVIICLFYIVKEEELCDIVKFFV